jgi:sec-independent protein translocase protein TatA
MNFGPQDMIIILVLALLLFGGRKLPELGSSVGKTITNFRKGLAEAKQEEEAEAEAAAAGTAVPSEPTPTENEA